MTINLLQLTPDSLRSGEFKIIFPDFYSLQDVIENNAWHNNQSVFDHSLHALQALDNYFEDSSEHRITFPRYEFLRIAVLFHDIGKLKALYQQGSKTMSPSHGPVGGWMIAPILKGLGFRDVDTAYVVSLITDHILVCDLLELSVNLNDPSFIEMLKVHRPETWRDLLLIAYADVLSCNTDDETIKNEIKARVRLIEMSLHEK